MTRTAVAHAPHVRVGMVGCGQWGRNVAQAVDRNRRLDLVALADANPLAAADLAATLTSAPEVLEPSELLASGAIDAVLIVTDAATHHELAMKSLTSGKHTFVEKPLATSGEEAAALEAESARANLTLMVGHTFLYSDYVRHVDEALDQSLLGKLRYVHLQRLAYGRFRDDVNVVWNLGAHDVSLLMHWAKRPPRAVSCTDYAFSRPSLSDVALMTLDFEDWLGHVHLSVVDPHKVRRATVAGTLAGIVYDDVEGEVLLTENATGRRRRLGGGSGQRPLDIEIDHFADCILTGQRPVTDGIQGTWVSAVLEAATESAASGGSWQPLHSPSFGTNRSVPWLAPKLGPAERRTPVTLDEELPA